MMRDQALHVAGAVGDDQRVGRRMRDQLSACGISGRRIGTSCGRRIVLDRHDLRDELVGAALAPAFIAGRAVLLARRPRERS